MDRNWQNCHNFFVVYSFPSFNPLQIDILEGFSRANPIIFDPQLLWGLNYLEFSSFIFLDNSSTNQARLLITSLFSVISSDNSKLFNSLFGHAFGLGVCGAAILFKP